LLRFAKLPGWFTVTTPIGTYNPDWAIVMKNADEFGDVVDEQRPLLYLVHKTKSTHDLTQLRPNEARKIACGQRHFDSLDVNYKLVVTADELP
jgi:type III restriction enzyme